MHIVVRRAHIVVCVLSLGCLRPQATKYSTIDALWSEVSPIASAAISMGNAASLAWQRVLLQPAPEPLQQSSCNEGALWWTWVENACKSLKKVPDFPQDPWTQKKHLQKVYLCNFLLYILFTSEPITYVISPHLSYYFNMSYQTYNLC